jgi:hypothetical protein
MNQKYKQLKSQVIYKVYIEMFITSDEKYLNVISSLVMVKQVPFDRSLAVLTAD